MLPGTFGVFETFRILIPGYIAALCASWYIRLFIPSVTAYLESSKLSAVTFAGFGLVAGLILYLHYIPHDTKSYRESQPSQYLLERAQQLGVGMTAEEAKEIYFYLLNNYFPESFRERIFYYGNVYRVAQKTWLISIAFAVLAASTQICYCLLRSPNLHWKQQLVFLGILLLSFFLLFWRAEKHAIQILKGQIKWLQMRDKLVSSLLTNPVDKHAKP